MSDKATPGNRQEVSELMDRGETMFLQDLEHEQLRIERGERIRNQREELGCTLEDFSEITGLSY